MSPEQDQARLIAERVARRVAGNRNIAPPTSPRSRNGEPVREELSSIREGLHDLETKLERIESNLVSDGSSNANGSTSERPRARVIDFISSGPPLRSTSPVVASSASAEQHAQDSSKTSSEFFQFIPATQSPWLGRLPAMLGQDNPQSAILNPQTVDHPSQERFGIEEATVAELVEFFEKEKKCSVDPSGKPCDHCAMCSSRGF